MITALVIFFAVFVLWAVFFWMPGKSFAEEAPLLSEEERALSGRLHAHVEMLSEQIGARSTVAWEGLKATEDYIENFWQELGYPVWKNEFLSTDTHIEVSNIFVEVVGSERPEQKLVVGAHYDALGARCPGANDNGTGVAALLEISRVFRELNPKFSIIFVAFVNEEQPHFMEDTMGSRVFAKNLFDSGVFVKGMIALETIGYFDDAEGSQKYPFPLSYFYPSKGNFIGFVSNIASGTLVRRSIQAFRRHASVPSEGISAPAVLPGISWSDHAAFWEVGVPALMITDTAPYRYPFYHLSEDTIDKIDFERFTRVTIGVEKMLRDLAAVG